VVSLEKEAGHNKLATLDESTDERSLTRPFYWTGYFWHREHPSPRNSENGGNGETGTEDSVDINYLAIPGSTEQFRGRRCQRS
jgi:hypothetical protein